MGVTDRPFVEMNDGDYVVSGSRVLLEGIVQEFLDGRSPETIQQSFPALKLAEVYGAIAFYLDHQPEITSYLQQRRVEYEMRRQANIGENQDFHMRLREKIGEVTHQEPAHP